MLLYCTPADTPCIYSPSVADQMGYFMQIADKDVEERKKEKEESTRALREERCRRERTLLSKNIQPTDRQTDRQKEWNLLLWFLYLLRSPSVPHFVHALFLRRTVPILFPEGRRKNRTVGCCCHRSFQTVQVKDLVTRLHLFCLFLSS